MDTCKYRSTTKRKAFCNFQVLDEEGRCALHLAVSCGRRDLCHWLIKAGKGDINLKDSESGYTPLHRSIFYGHINIAVTLIEVSSFKRRDTGIVFRVFSPNQWPL